MARAGYCSACAQNVYLTADGGCVNGHPASYVTNAYDVADAVPAAAPAPAPASMAPPVPAYGAPVQAPPKKKRTGLIIALVLVGLLLLCGCAAVGGLVLFASDSRQETSSQPTPKVVVSKDDTAKLEAALTLVKAMNTGDAELLKSVMPAATAAGVSPDFWTSFVQSTSADAPKLGTVDRKAETIVVETIYDAGTGSMTFTISPTDGDSVDIHTVRADKSTTDSVAKVGKEGEAWKVLALSNGTTTIPFDLDGLNAFLANPPK